MRFAWASAPLWGAVVFATLAAPPATCDTLVLDGDDVIDWVRVLDSSAWKYRDACLHPNALLKFKLDWNWPVAQITGARLELFVEKAQAGDGIQLWHVGQDAWSYGERGPDTLRNWPAWHAIGSFSLADSGVLGVDVTPHLQEEFQAGDSVFSIKLTSPPLGGGYPRLASPLTLVQRMRPRIVVDFVGPAAPPPIPDLAVSTADIRLSPMRVGPGEGATVQASLRNNGPGAAANVAVSFWDGAPPTGTLIGTTTVPAIAAGGGTASASLGWTAVRGAHEIHVVLDPANAIAETDETNNADFREFEVRDPGPVAEVLTDVESFERAGLGAWHTDFEVPEQFGGFGPKSFYLNRSGAEAYQGHHSMELYLDGTADDGTVWLERTLPVDPYTDVEVQVDFELFRYFGDIAFMPVVSVSPFDPERELDFSIVPVGPQEGWAFHTHKKTVSSGPFDLIHVAVGLTVSWETPGTFYLDLIRTQATYLGQTGVPPGGGSGAASIELGQNRPNPMGPLTTIWYRLAEDGPVRLRIFDASGRLLTTLRDGRERAGIHEVHWDGSDRDGRPLPSGVYFYRLDTAGEEDSRKLLLVR